jgi:DNA-binding CsgD family transcriptional regulator
MDERRFAELIDLTYEAALDPTSWPALMARVSGAVGAAGAALTRLNQRTGRGVGIAAGFDTEALQSLSGRFANQNVLLARDLDPRFGPRPRILLDEQVLAKPALMRTEFYNEFLQPLGIHSVAMIGLATHGMDGVVLNLTRPVSRSQFGADALRTLSALHPHLIRSYGLTVRLAGLHAAADDAADAMDRSPYGLVIADEAGRVRRMNRLAGRLCGEPGGLRILAGRLSAARGGDSRRLEALICAAASAEPETRRGGSMVLRTPGRRLPLAISVAPVRTERSLLFQDGPSALVCIADPHAGVSVPGQRLMELFALTPAEARVAQAMLEGGGLRDVAASLGVSFFTVRAHLARIFAKTGTNRQAELVRLMTLMIGADLS